MGFACSMISATNTHNDSLLISFVR